MIRVIVTTFTTYFEGIPFGGALEQAIKAQTFYMEPGHEKDPRFIYGAWDGKVNLFTHAQLRANVAGHQCPTGLLNRVLNIISSRREQYQLINAVPTPERDPKMTYLNTAPLVMRDYQDAAVAALTTPQPLDLHQLHAWHIAYGSTPIPEEVRANSMSTRLGGVLQAGTGAGKTVCAAKVIQTLQNKTVFLVNQKDLMAQTIEEFKRFLGCDIGQCGGGKIDSKDITVATIQTVCRAYDFVVNEGEKDGPDPSDDNKARIKQMMEEARVVIVDECHGLPARTAYQAVMMAVNAFCIVGLSASPWRDDGLDILIEAAAGPVVYKISASDLIARGFLVPPEITLHMLPAPTEMTLDRYSDNFDKLYKAWVVNDHQRNAYIADLATDAMIQGEVVLVLVKQIAHGEILQKMIPHSIFLQGKLSAKKRKEIIDATKKGEILCLIATSLADQGLDLPVASVLILAGGGKSSTKALQRIGRILRLHLGKKMAWVHDLVDQHSNLKRHYYERVKIYKQEPLFKLLTKNVTYSPEVLATAAAFVTANPPVEAKKPAKASTMSGYYA